MKLKFSNRCQVLRDELLVTAIGYRSSEVIREVSIFRVWSNDDVIKYVVRLYSDHLLSLTREYSACSAAYDDFYNCVKYL